MSLRVLGKETAYKPLSVFRLGEFVQRPVYCPGWPFCFVLAMSSVSLTIYRPGLKTEQILPREEFQCVIFKRYSLKP